MKSNVSIAERGRAPGKAAAHRFEHDQVAALDPPVAHRGVERQRNRGRRGVGMRSTVTTTLSGGRPSLRAVASRIRALAWCGTTQSTSLDVEGRRRPALRSSTSARLTTAWRNTSRPFMRSLPTVPVVEGPPSTIEQVVVAAVGVELGREDAAVAVLGLQHERAGAVAEQDAGARGLPSRGCG